MALNECAFPSDLTACHLAKSENQLKNNSRDIFILPGAFFHCVVSRCLSRHQQGIVLLARKQKDFLKFWKNMFEVSFSIQRNWASARARARGVCASERKRWRGDRDLMAWHVNRRHPQVPDGVVEGTIGPRHATPHNRRHLQVIRSPLSGSLICTGSRRNSATFSANQWS